MPNTHGLISTSLRYARRASKFIKFTKPVTRGSIRRSSNSPNDGYIQGMYIKKIAPAPTF